MQIGTPINKVVHRPLFVEQQMTLPELRLTPVVPYRVEGSP